MTGEKEFPDFLKKDVKNDTLEYFCNTLVTYTRARRAHQAEHHLGLGGARRQRRHPLRLSTGGPRRASRSARARPRSAAPRPTSSPTIRQGQAGHRRRGAASAWRALQSKYPGLDVEERGNEHPAAHSRQLRTTHEEHFAEVARRFFGYLARPQELPAWEKPNMLAKYYVTTKGTELSRASAPVKVAERIAPK